MKVVPFTPDRLDEVLAFRARMFPRLAHGVDTAHFRWRFLENPLSPDPTYLLALEGDRVVGQWAGLGDRVWSRGREWPVVWMVDLVVDPAYRDKMVAMELFREAGRLGRALLVVGATEQVVDFYRVFRWERLAVLDTFYAVFRPGPLAALAGLDPGGWRSRGLGLLGLLGAHLHPAALGPALERLDRFGGEVDGLFAGVRDGLGVTPVRSAEVLRWKLERRPVGRHLALALRRPGGGLRGLGIVKLRERAGVARWADVADILVDAEDSDGFDQLARGCCREAARAGLDFVRLRCSLPQHTTRLRAPAWVRRSRPPSDDLFVFAGKDEAARAALTARPWHLTAFSSDTVDTGADEWMGALP